jgi:hypothetical protein
MDTGLSALVSVMPTTDADKWVGVGIHLLIPGA